MYCRYFFTIKNDKNEKCYKQFITIYKINIGIK